MFFNGTEKCSERQELRLSAAYEVAEEDPELIKQGILREFLLQNKAEVRRMSIFEYNEEAVRQALQEEAREEGYEKGRDRGIDSLKNFFVPIGIILYFPMCFLLLKNILVKHMDAMRTITVLRFVL